ncbi:MAG: glycosyltransferase [Pseudomonadota bacterium]
MEEFQLVSGNHVAINILVFTTLYPNPIQSNHGIFVEKRLLELLKRHPVTATVIAPVPQYPRWLARRRNLPEYHKVPDREIRNGVTIWHPRYPVIPGITWRIAPWFLSWCSTKLATRLHREHRYDLIDAHFAFPDGVAAGSIAENLGIPYLVTARGSDINDSPIFNLPRRFIQNSFKTAVALIAVSRRLKERMIELGAFEEKIKVLPNGVDIAVFKPGEASDVATIYGVDAPFILCVGSLRELKGHHLVIEAMAHHPALHSYSLLIAGIGTMESELRQLISRERLENRVKLIGEVPNEKLASLYSAASLFVLASSNEGCPNVVLEALACNTRVVASDVGAVPDLLPQSLHPFMISERNSKAIGVQMAACLAADIEQDGPRNRALALGWGETCENLFKVLQQVATR